MATGSLGALVVSLTAETAQFTAALDKASYTAQKNFGNIASFAKNAAGGLAALYGAQSIVGFVKSQIDAADATGKMAQKVGVSVEELSKLQYAAKLSDVSNEQLQTGLVKLSKGMVEAANGSGQLRNALSSMGLSAKNNDGSMKSSSVLLSEIADKFAGYEDGVNKTNLAVQLFGKSGAELIPLLNGGSAAIKDAGDELERFGAVISEKVAQNAEIFNDNLTRLAVAGSVLGKSIANEVMPYLNQLAEEFLIARSNGLGFFEMLSMGLRSTDYQKQLAQIEDEIKAVNQAWAFPIGPSRDERLASLERQKKTLIDVQTLMMKDGLAGPPKSLMREEKKKDAPFSIDLDKAKAEAEKYAKGLGRAQDANDKFIASMREMAQKSQLNIDTAFMTENEKKLAQDMITINKSFLDTQAEVTKQYAEGRLSLSAYNEQAAILAGNYQFAIDQAKNMKDAQDQLNNSWSYGATRALNDYANEASNVAKQVEGAFGRAAKGMEDSLVEFVMTGKSSFGSLINSMISDMVRLIIQQSITAPLAKAGASFFGGLFSGAGGISSGPASVTDNSSTWTPPSFDGGGFTGLGARSGGADGKGGFLALLHPKESVIDHTKGGGVAASSGPIFNISISNEGAADGYQATATARKNDSGIDIDVMVRKAVTSDLARNGPMSQQFAGAFGLRRGAA